MLRRDADSPQGRVATLHRWEQLDLLVFSGTDLPAKGFGDAIRDGINGRGSLIVERTHSARIRTPLNVEFR